MSDVILGDATLVLTTDNKGVTKGIATAKSQVKSLGKATARAGKSLSRNLTLPLVGVGVAAGKMAVDFESSLSQIEGLVGVSRKQVDAWREDIIALGPAVGKGPQELAEGMFFVTSAGLKGSEALDTLTLSAKASAAGLGSTAVVADAATSAINAYGIETVDAAQATNVLVGTVRLGKASADSIAGSLGKVIPLASEMGVRFDQVGASIAAMTRLGFTADEATTSLVAVMSGLKKPTVDAEKALEEFGLSSAEMRAQIREGGLLTVLTDLQERIGDNDVAMSRIFPNIRALKGVLSLVGKNTAATEQIFSEMATTTTFLDDAFAAASNTSKFKLKAAMSELTGVMIQLGSQVLPVVVPLFSKLASVVGDAFKWFQSLTPQMQMFIGIAAGIAVALGPTLTVLGALATAIGFLITPIGLVIAAIVGVGGLTMVIVKNWDTIVKVTKDLYEGVKKWLVDKFVAILDSVKKATKAVTQFFEDMFMDVVGGSIVPDMVKGIKEQFAKLVNVMVKPSKKATDEVVKQFKDMRRSVEADAAFIGPTFGFIGPPAPAPTPVDTRGGLAAKRAGAAGRISGAVSDFSNSQLAAIGTSAGKSMVEGTFREEDFVNTLTSVMAAAGAPAPLVIGTAIFFKLADLLSSTLPKLPSPQERAAAVAESQANRAALFEALGFSQERVDQINTEIAGAEFNIPDPADRFPANRALRPNLEVTLNLANSVIANRQTTKALIEPVLIDLVRNLQSKLVAGT